MANKTAAHTKGRNVQPASSTLKAQTLPADCSATAWAKTPEDGEWLFFAGFGEPATHDIASVLVEGSAACMVWGHADRSDRSARSDKRVTCLFKESFHCSLGLYNYDDEALPNRGDLLILADSHEAINGDTDKKRLVAQPTAPSVAAMGDGVETWVVGFVIGGTGTTVKGDPLEVFLYDMPRLVTFVT